MRPGAPGHESIALHHALGAQLAEQRVVERGGARQIIGTQRHVSDHYGLLLAADECGIA